MAPGVELRSAAVGSGSGATALSGTSIAASQVAGAAALLRQMHPRWSPSQVKAALMNTAAPVRTAQGVPAPPSLGGAGRLDMRALASLDLLAYADEEDSAVALMYGAPWVTQPLTSTRLLRLENQSDGVRTVTLSATAVVTESGVAVVLPPGPITLPPRGTVSVPISLTVDPRALDFTPDAATPLREDEHLRYFMAEHGGHIDVKSGAGVRVRPAHAAHFGPVDFYLDQQLLDDSLDSREVEEYSDTTPGTHTVRLLRPRDGPDAPPLLTAEVSLLEGRDYTLILVGRPGALGIVVVDETAPAPPPEGQALIHFVNANRTEPNWDIGPLDVYLDGVRQVAALPVGQTSAYLPIAAGTHTAQFYRAGADPARERPVSRRTFVVSPGELILVGTGRHDDEDGDLDDLEQRSFVGRSTPRTSLSLRVPFLVFPKSASEARAADASVVVPSDVQTFTVSLHNTGARAAGLRDGLAGPQTPLASAFELAATSPAHPGLSGSLRSADLKYLGVTSSSAVAPSVDAATIYFGMASYAPWSTPNEIEFRVYIDSNLDGAADYLLLNSSWGAFQNRPSDVFISTIYHVRSDGSPGDPITYTSWGTLQPPTSIYGFDVTPFNTSVMFQAVGARFVGLTPAQTRFRYWVETRSRDADRFGQVVDRVPAEGALEYDLARPAIAPINLADPILTERPVFVDIEGGQITGTVDPAELAARGVQPLLVLHHHNPPSLQAELVEVRGGSTPPGPAPGSFRAFFPIVQVRAR